MFVSSSGLTINLEDLIKCKCVTGGYVPWHVYDEGDILCVICSTRVMHTGKEVFAKVEPRAGQDKRAYKAREAALEKHRDIFKILEEKGLRVTLVNIRDVGHTSNEVARTLRDEYYEENELENLEYQANYMGRKA